MTEDAEFYRSYQLMEIFQCASIGALYRRLGPAPNYVSWLVYLERRDELEQERLRAIMGGNTE
jgi:hypothetical protein